MVHDSYADGARLLADIGGTNARFALEHGAGRVGDVHTLACADYAYFDDAVRAYLNRLPARRVRHAVIAIANPVDGDAVKMTNHHWAFSIAASRQALGLDTLLVVNDFAALAMALPALGPADLDQIGGGKAVASGVIGLVGAGTGLGVAGLVPVDGRWVALQSEGGHVAFSPFDEREVAVLQHCWQRYEHVRPSASSPDPASCSFAKRWPPGPACRSTQACPRRTSSNAAWPAAIRCAVKRWTAFRVCWAPSQPTWR